MRFESKLSSTMPQSIWLCHLPSLSWDTYPLITCLLSSPQKHCVLSNFRPLHILFPLLGMLLSVPPPVPPCPPSWSFTQLIDLSFNATSAGKPSSSPSRRSGPCAIHTFSQHPVVFLRNKPITIHGFVCCLPPVLEWLEDKLYEGRNSGYLVSTTVSPASTGPYIRCSKNMEWRVPGANLWFVQFHIPLESDSNNEGSL